MRYVTASAIIGTFVVAAVIAGCAQPVQQAAVKPNAATFTLVKNGAYDVPTATVTCPPAYPQVVGGGGQGTGLVLTEPLADMTGWTVSATPSTTAPTRAFAICGNF